MGRAQHAGRHTGRAARLAVLLAVAVPIVSGCSVDEILRFGWPVGVTPQAESMRQLWTYSAIAALIVGAITWAAMFWAVAAYRKRKGEDDTAPRQTQYNLPVEVVFTVVPTIIVLLLFAFTINVQNYVNADEPRPDLRVTIEAFQWNWEFTYPDTRTPDGEPVSTLGTSNEIPILVLPTQQRIEFTQFSNDVIHSFWVVEFLFKRDVFPRPDVNDQDNVWQVDRIDQEGAFVGRCAELCGTYHAFMNFEVRALAPALFERYLQLRSQVNPRTGAPYSTAEALQTMNCGELCAPQAITTYPFDTDRDQRAASQRVREEAGR